MTESFKMSFERSQGIIMSQSFNSRATSYPCEVYKTFFGHSAHYKNAFLLSFEPSQE